jgi:uncharacterized membrane protein YuzA (DUF378 family)
VITLETAIAAVITFVVGGICGYWLTIKLLTFSLERSEEARKNMREKLDKCERG